MKKIAYIFLASFLLFSCEQYPEPGTETIESFSFQYLGNFQMTEAGNYLPEDIGVQVYYDSPYSAQKKTFYLLLEVVAGDGKIDKQKIIADENGQMLTKWKLGSTSNEQVLKAKIFDTSDRLYADFELEATAILSDGWNTITTGHLTGIRDMVVDTINNRSMVYCGLDLYSRGNKFYNWGRIISNTQPLLYDLEINSEGTVFGSAYDGYLYKSEDWGKTWKMLSQPIPNRNKYFGISISKDDYIWASKAAYGLYCSKDGGYTWQNDTIGLPKTDHVHHVYQYKDSSHLALSLQILQSFDDGITWKELNTPEYSLTMFVSDKNEIIVQNQEQGFSVHKSTDSGMTYRKVLSADVAFGTTPDQNFLKFKEYYYLLAPGGGIFKTLDFEEFENIKSIYVQRNLYIDHEGTIYASGHSGQPVLILPNNK